MSKVQHQAILAQTVPQGNIHQLTVSGVTTVRQENLHQRVQPLVKIVLQENILAPGSLLCTDCEAGKYSSTLAATSGTVCMDCEAGKSSTAGSDSINDCTTCPAGKYSSIYGGTECTDCAAGKYSSTLAAISSNVCMNCPDGKGSPEGSISISNCIDCTAGKVRKGGVCLDCPIGKYQSPDRTTSCVNCPFRKNNIRSRYICVVCVAVIYPLL